MKAIIPTAGVGTRLRPFTHTIPKVLLHVADKPILGHILDKIVAEGIRDVTFVVGYLGDMIEKYVRREYPALDSHFVLQEEAKGLGHAIYLTREQCADPDEPALIILGDTILEADLSILHNAETDMIGVREVEDPRRFGVVEMQGEFISAMVEKPEKPKTNLAIVGIYYLNNLSLLYECLEANMKKGVLTKGEIQLTDALQGMIERGTRMKAFKVEGWYDCGKPETLLATNHALLEKSFMNTAPELRERFGTVRIKPPVYVAPGADVSDSILGPDVTIAENAVVKNCIVSNSIINEEARLKDVLLADSIIGSGAVVQAAALRLYVGDKSEVIFE
jgi:glucose-1-phosphate thymidylyltransferase